jgi:putative membrane protein
MSPRVLIATALVAGAVALSWAAHSDSLPPDASYRPLPSLIAAALGGLAEIDLAHLADQKTQNDRVREFARRMIEDHTPANMRLGSLAGADEILIPRQLDAEHRQVSDSLGTLTGPDFDIEYLRAQVQDHQRMVQLLEYEIGSGEDTELQQFAADMLPNIFKHLHLARDLLASVSAQNPSRAALPPHTVSGMPTPQTPRPPEN